MALFNFGQPRDSIVHVSYVVEDLHASMADYVATFDVGPWFILLEKHKVLDSVYRGQPTDFMMSLATAYVGHIQIELVQMEDEKPSVFREVVEKRGYGFHHYGIPVMDMDEKVRKMAKTGWEPIFETRIPGGKHAIFLDRPGGVSPAFPGMIELIPDTPEREKRMTEIYKAALDWDGADPVRSMLMK